MERFRLTIILATLSLLAAATAACESDNPTPLRSMPAATTLPGGDDTDADVDQDLSDVEESDEDPAANETNDNTLQLSEVEVMTFFKDTCSECHGEDDQGNKGPNFSAWSMDKQALSLDAFETSVFAPIVYATLFNQVARKPSSSPSKMPPRKLDKTDRAKVRGVLGWFNVSLPFVVAEAEQSYGIDTGTSSGAAELRFVCDNPITARQFLSRMTTALFDRTPTQTELGEWTAEELQAPVTPKARATIVGKLRKSAWKSDFIENGGLRKLADAIGGGPAIPQDSDTVRGFAAGTSADLKQELFQLMRARFDEWDYDTYLTTEKVMVTQNTAPLYACTPPTETGAWSECALTPPRAGFFTTLGYLNSKPSTFLRENNNYGRVATMYLTLMGQGFKAATNGPAGGEVAPLPGCIEQDDSRRHADAARGTVAVPSFGNVCQACHISRNLAVGSILFRPFATNGTLYDPNTLGDTGAVDRPDFELAIKPEWTFGLQPSAPATQPVDAVFLRGLLSNSLSSNVKACAVTGNKKSPTVGLKTVNDLAKYLMRNESALVRGFVRHAHRAYAISQTVNFDLVYTAVGSYGDGKKKIPDLLEAYFGSETFACAAEEK